MCGTENGGSKGSTSEKRGVVGLVVGNVMEGACRVRTEP